jgi:hypothetical protein
MDAIRHLLVSRPPKADLQERAGKLSVWLKSIRTLHAANSTKFTGWWQKHKITSDEWVDYDDLEEDGNDEDDFVVGDQEEFDNDDDNDDEEVQYEEEEEEKEEKKERGKAGRGRGGRRRGRG